MIIFPAIDIIEGQCVRLSQGLYDTKKIYSKDPVDMARQFEDSGFTHLHLVDLDGAKAGKVVNYAVLEGIAQHTSLHVDFGGGIRSKQEVINVMSAGAKKVNIGSLAVREPEKTKRWMQEIGSEAIILSADVKGKHIAIHGWQDKTEYDLHDFVRSYRAAGIRYITCTDISKDGELTGASVDLYQNLIEEFDGLNVIASGGVNSMENLSQLDNIGCYGAIVGKAIYEGHISLEHLVTLNQ